MIWKDPAPVVWKILPSVLQYLVEYTSICILEGWKFKWHICVKRLLDVLPVAPAFIINKHIHPFGVCNPKYKFYLNSVIQMLLPNRRTISPNFQFNSSTEGPLTKCLFETAQSASNSTDVDALKFPLVQNDTMAKFNRMGWNVLWC